MKRVVNCPVCNSQAQKATMVCKDYTVSNENFSLVTCEDCGFLFTSPRPDDVALGDYYKSEDYISHSDTRKGIVARLYHWVRNYTLNRKIALINNYVSRGTILDYGCGTGMFLARCKLEGWKTFGMEPDPGARQIAKESTANVFGDKEELKNNSGNSSFDVITLWHVLEHVTDLEATLGYFKQQLNKDGVLIIAVPNHKSFDARHYSEFWAAYDVPRHLYHFDKTTVERLLSRHGFKLVDTEPMKFDSYYVSMLSEKYKHGTVKYLSAFVNGFKSNWQARASKEYSSRIYIFKHQ